MDHSGAAHTNVPSSSMASRVLSAGIHTLKELQPCECYCTHQDMQRLCRHRACVRSSLPCLPISAACGARLSPLYARCVGDAS